MAMAQTSISNLSFKGTHNSFASECGECPWYCGLGCTWCDCPNSPPNMNHSPAVQVDDFGVWGLELDFSIVRINGTPRLIVGHSGYGDQDDTWANPSFGVYVRDYIADLQGTRSFAYRPLFVRFEKHSDWGDDEFDPAVIWGPLLETEIRTVFEDDEIFGPDSLGQAGGVWPAVPQLAGKIIAVADWGSWGSGMVFRGSPTGLTSWFSSEATDQCTDASVIASVVDEGYNLPRWDQYQADWTFGCGLAPPSPLCVEAGNGGPYQAPEPLGQPWGPCPNGDHSGHVTPVIVSEQGTFSFPYNRVAEAYGRALDGWTILIGSGHYPEALTMTKVLTLKASGGTVVIGN
jgi:hypothetical protein